MKISVAMAAYNGAKYIGEQIKSVLPQLKEEDELIVSLDPSTDQTAALLAAQDDPRIRLLDGSGRGVVANFENAIAAAEGDIIFLCDQDDVWQPHKVEKVLAAFADPAVLLVLHDAAIVDSELREMEPSFFAWRQSRSGYLRNLWKNSYIGCCMAFRRELKEWALPFPSGIPMHDQWLGLLAEKRHGTVLLDEPLLLYRRHENNVSAVTHSGLGQMLSRRLIMLRELRKREKSCR